MVIDTSALVAILFGEPEAARVEAAILAAAVREVGAPSYVELPSSSGRSAGPQGWSRLTRS